MRKDFTSQEDIGRCPANLEMSSLVNRQCSFSGEPDSGLATSFTRDYLLMVSVAG